MAGLSPPAGLAWETYIAIMLQRRSVESGHGLMGQCSIFVLWEMSEMMSSAASVEPLVMLWETAPVSRGYLLLITSDTRTNGWCSLREKTWGGKRT